MSSARIGGARHNRRGEGSWGTVRRGDRVYIRFRISIDGRTIERVGLSRAKIEKEAAKLKARARARLIGDDEEITLERWALDRWLEMKRTELGPPGEKTIRNYESVLTRHILPALGRVKVRDIRASHRRALQATLTRKGLKPSTVNVIDGILKAVLQAAADDELPVVVSAISAVKPVRNLPEDTHSLSADDVKEILEKSAGSFWHTLWVCFATTGARDAEVRALRWEDLDGDTLHIRRQLPQQPGDPPKWLDYLKGRKRGRVVPVVPLLALALREHKARQNATRLGMGRMWSDYGLVFPDELGRALPSQRINRQFEAACEDAGIKTWKGLGVHRLRGTANEILREAGVDTPTRAQLLGHSAAVNEQSYTHDSAKLAAEAMAKLGRSLA